MTNTYTKAKSKEILCSIFKGELSTKYFLIEEKGHFKLCHYYIENNNTFRYDVKKTLSNKENAYVQYLKNQNKLDSLKYKKLLNIPIPNIVYAINKEYIRKFLTVNSNNNYSLISTDDTIGAIPYYLDLYKLVSLSNDEREVIDIISKAHSKTGYLFELSKDGLISFGEDYPNLNQELSNLNKNKIILKLFDYGIIYCTDWYIEIDSLYFEVIQEVLLINYQIRINLNENKNSSKPTKPYVRQDFTGTQKVVLYKLSKLHDKNIHIKVDVDINGKYKIDTSVFDLNIGTLVSLVNRNILKGVKNNNESSVYFVLTENGYKFAKSLKDYKPNNKKINEKYLK